MKTCTGCKQNLPATPQYFGLHQVGIYGLRPTCKECRKIEGKQYRTENPEKVKASALRSYRKHADRTNRKKREEIAFLKQEQPTEYRKLLDRKNELSRKYYRKRGVEGRKIRALKRLENIDKHREQGRRAARKAMGNPQYRCSMSISRSMRRSLNGKGGAPWESLVDFTRKDLINHFEKLFQPGMSWNNYGEWHIDHIIPVSVHNFSKPEHPDFKRCWSLKNLQPMWEFDNKSKNAKLKKHFQPRLQMEAA